MGRTKKDKTKTVTKAPRKPGLPPVEKLKRAFASAAEAVGRVEGKLQNYGVTVSMSSVVDALSDARGELEALIDKGLVIASARGRKDRQFTVSDRVEAFGITGTVKEIIGEGSSQCLRIESDDGTETIVQRKLVKKIK